ncbi:MAG: hypothetical protein ACJARD_001714 [Alphaproteobacteria bacterium]|jgi:hypothetical protein
MKNVLDNQYVPKNEQKAIMNAVGNIQLPENFDLTPLDMSYLKRSIAYNLYEKPVDIISNGYQSLPHIIEPI